MSGADNEFDDWYGCPEDRTDFLDLTKLSLDIYRGTVIHYSCVYR